MDFHSRKLVFIEGPEGVMVELCTREFYSSRRSQNPTTKIVRNTVANDIAAVKNSSDRSQSERNCITNPPAEPVDYAITCRPASRPALLWNQHFGRLLTSRHLLRPHPKGCQACRLADHSTNHIRIDNQPQDRQGARPHRAADIACPRRRGDRITILFAALHESAFGGKADIPNFR
jgi:hypothetical protein